MTSAAFLLLRLEAPLMSFGGPMVDQIGRTRRFPGQSQITGLLGNALGYSHTDADRLDRLQDRLRMAAALVEPGELLRDYHTVDLGQPHLTDTGWTTRGHVETRAGASSDTTHIRYRWYLSDALVLVAVTLVPEAEEPTLAQVAAALDHPARPLFIGRKTCLPSAPIRLHGPLQAASARAALDHGIGLLRTARPVRAASTPVEIDARLAHPLDAAEERLVDRRDWRNQMHTGERAVQHVSVDRQAVPQAVPEVTP